MGLIVAVLMAVTALLGHAMPANAATGPDGFPILYADSGNVVHQCEVIGSDYGPAYTGSTPTTLDAVVCVDIDTTYDSAGYYATGAVEAFCEENDNASETFPCPIINIDSIFANADNGATTASYNCEDNCGGGRPTLYTATFSYTGGADCTSSSGHDVWSEATGDTTIYLPAYSDGLYYDNIYSISPNGANDGTNYSSGHYWVCP